MRVRAASESLPEALIAKAFRHFTEQVQMRYVRPFRHEQHNQVGHRLAVWRIEATLVEVFKQSDP